MKSLCITKSNNK